MRPSYLGPNGGCFSLFNDYVPSARCADDTESERRLLLLKAWKQAPRFCLAIAHMQVGHLNADLTFTNTKPH